MAYVFEVSKYSQYSFPTDHDMCLEQPNIFTELCRCDQSHVHFSTQCLGSEDSVTDMLASSEANKQLM